MTDADVSHLSIGEVLSLIQEEFPDVTISKIRFLESQGLIDPERTPSGYRKFYEADVERLRWILQQQRDHFLPLKVIKDRLIEADVANQAMEFVAPPDPEPEVEPPPAPETVPEPDSGGQAGPGAAAGTEAEVEAARPPAADPQPPEVPASAAPDDDDDDRSAANPMDVGPTELTLNADELAHTTGLDLETVDELRAAGLLRSRQVGADHLFDSDAVVVARSVARFAAFGIEIRHLRMYKVSSEREAGFFEQAVMPLLKQRNPTARQRAIEQVGQMATLGQQLHAALLRQALDDSLG